jgi:hypothetical protein
MGNSWSKLAVPYLLPRYVFPLMKHAGWIDLRTHELDALCLEGVGASEHCSWATELSLASLPLAVSRKVMYTFLPAPGVAVSAASGSLLLCAPAAPETPPLLSCLRSGKTNGVRRRDPPRCPMLHMWNVCLTGCTTR